MPFVESQIGQYTGNDLIEEVQRLMLSGQRETLNRLHANVPAGAKNLTLDFEPDGIAGSSLLNIDLETYRVWSVDRVNKEVAVQPAMDGTKTNVHVAGALVYVNPRFSRAAMWKAINDEIVALSSPMNGLFTMRTLEFDYNPAVAAYDLSGMTRFQSIYEVRCSVPGPERVWPRIENWQYSPSSDLSTFPSGHSLTVREGWPGRKIQVLYRSEYTPLVDPDDDVAEVSGVPSNVQRAIPMGVIINLGAYREIKRNFTESQGDSRRADEVGAGAITQSITALRATRAEIINQEVARLIRLYPPRKS